MCVSVALTVPDPTIVAQLLVFGLLLGSIYALVALGLTMIFGVMDVINLAHGALMVVGMYTVWYVSGVTGLSPFLAIPVAVVVVALLGGVIYLATVAPFVDTDDGNDLVVTLGWLLILVAGMELLFSHQPRSLDIDLGSYELVGVFLPGARLFGLVVALAAVAAMIGLLYRTRLGLAIRATADNRQSAMYVGLDTRRVDTLTFALGAGLAGLAGAIIPFLQRFDPHLGNFYLVTAFVVVVLGGLGSFRGALVGGVLVGLVQVFGSFYLPGSSYRILVLLVFILVLLFLPEGLHGGGGRG